ncbi:MAG: S49 family peptidase [Candidatus Paceibacterota bacterium]
MPKFLKRILKIFGLFLLIFVASGVSYFVYDSVLYSSYQNISGGAMQGDCNVLGINIRGDLYTYLVRDEDGYVTEDYLDATSSEEIIDSLENAKNDTNVKAVMFDVDSYGGAPVAGEEIAIAIKSTEKPTVAFIRQAGVSAAYWAISSADWILASKSSDVGSIGVTMSYLEKAKQNEDSGLKYIELSSGKYKDAGDPDRILSKEEKEVLLRDVLLTHENFIRAVSENRNIPLEKVASFADGSSVLGEQAKSLGLIDAVGGYEEARNYLSEKIGEEVEVCWW